jgi:uncharacterized protein (TIRG00374 family)
MRRWRIALAIVAVAVAAVIVARRFPSPADTWAVLRGANPWWFAAAALLQVLSIAAFGLQERLLLRALGTPMSVRRSLAVAGAQSAITLGLPAGSAVATGYTLRQYKLAGSPADVAVTTVVLSGVMSLLGLAMPYLAVASAGVTSGSWWVAGVMAVLIAATWWLPRALDRRLSRGPVSFGAAPAWATRLWRRLVRVRRIGRRILTAMRSVRIGSWFAGVGLSALNWSADIACLAVVAYALHVRLDVWALGVGYLTVQVARHISFTSGGVGVVEPALLAVLVSAGVASAPSAAVVAGYRLLSCWLVILAGLPLVLTLRRTARHAPEPAEPPAEPPGTTPGSPA